MRRRILVSLLWLFGLFAVVSHHFPLFRVRAVVVRGNHGVSADTVIARLGASPGDNLFRVDLRGWAERTAALAAVEEVRAYVTLAGSVVMNIEEARPVCLVDTRPVAGVAGDGTILPLDRHPALGDIPLITGVGGEPVYYSRPRLPRLLTALHFYRRWRNQDEQYLERLAEIHVNPALEVGIYLWPDRRLVTLGRGDWNERLKTLWPVVRRLPPAQNPLDLRFSGQVVERS